MFSIKPRIRLIIPLHLVQIFRGWNDGNLRIWKHKHYITGIHELSFNSTFAATEIRLILCSISTEQLDKKMVKASDVSAED